MLFVWLHTVCLDQLCFWLAGWIQNKGYLGRTDKNITQALVNPIYIPIIYGVYYTHQVFPTFIDKWTTIHGSETYMSVENLTNVINYKLCRKLFVNGSFCWKCRFDIQLDFWQKSTSFGSTRISCVIFLIPFLFWDEFCHFRVIWGSFLDFSQNW